jgi:hypothetical protein
MTTYQEKLAEPIDIVYTWVNGGDPDYAEICKRYSKNPEDINPERYRDTYQLLKYSLRSLEKHLDWYRNIFIVTTRPQVPDWMDLSNPKLKIIHHDQIIDEEFLPTFNPNCIESFLHKIPGLSKHFLYLNDDFLFGSQTLLQDFMPNGKYRVFNTLLGENLGWRIYDGKNDIIGLGVIEHTPLFIKKEFWQAMTELFPEKQHSTRANKFRQANDLMTYKLYRYYLLKYQRSICKSIILADLLKINTFHKITNNLKTQQKSIAQLELKRPKFYCLNDDQRDYPNTHVVSLIKDFLNKNLSEKSSFELS